jgi:AraC family transcriptional regulator, transcriptional activator of pobA
VRDADGSVFSFGDFAANVRRQPDRTRLHRHAFLELFFFERGRGRHVNDFAEYAVQAPALVFVDAGHVHAWPDSLGLRGDMLSFDAGCVLPPVAGQSPALFLPPAPVLIPLTSDETKTIAAGFSRIRREWETRGEGWLRVVRGCLTVLHTDAVRAWTRQQPVAAPDTAGARLCREFLQLMEQHVNAEARPARLAALLGVSADHLSSVLRRGTGRTAQEHLHARLLLEARRLLAHSRLDAAEVAWALGFRDASYFGRFFRLRCGMSPRQFRSGYQQEPDSAG